MAFATLFYILYMLGGSFTGYCSSNLEKYVCKKNFVFGINIIASSLSGILGATILWTGQYIFLNKLTKENESLFALFFMIFSFSVISGNGFNYIFYSYSPNVTLYFTIFVGICILSFFLFLLLPKVVDKEELKREEEVANMLRESAIEHKKLIKILRVMFEGKTLRITPYMFISGIIQGMVNSFLYKVTTKTCEKEPDLEIDKKIALTMICYGISSVLMGTILQKIVNKMHLKVLVIATTFLFLCGMSGLLYVWNNPSYYLMFIVIFFLMEK